MNKGRTCFGIPALSVVFGLLAVIPQQLFAQTEKGVALCDSKQFLDAEGVFKSVLQAEPWDTKARYYLGLALLEQGKFSDALIAIKKAQDDQNKAAQWDKPPIPSDYQIQLALARTCLGLKQYSEAWKSLDSARIENSSSSEVYLYRGIYYLQQKSFQEAATELGKSISLDAQNAYAHYYAGVAYSETGQADKMAVALKTFLKLAPSAPEAAKAKSMMEAKR